MKIIPSKYVRLQRTETQAIGKVNELLKMLDNQMRILRILKMGTEVCSMERLSIQVKKVI